MPPYLRSALLLLAAIYFPNDVLLSLDRVEFFDATKLRQQLVQTDIF